jgi:hypothetical protein
MTFVFNGNYNDLGQVAEWIGEFARIREEIIERTGRGFVYNDEIIGRIPGIGNKEKRPNTGSHEDTAIYLLQTLYRFWEQEARIIDLLAEGYEPIERLAGVERFSRVVLYPARNMGGSWAEYESARLVPETNAQQADVTGRISAVLPKGKRTHGHLVSGRRILVLR